METYKTKNYDAHSRTDVPIWCPHCKMELSLKETLKKAKPIGDFNEQVSEAYLWPWCCDEASDYTTSLSLNYGVDCEYCGRGIQFIVRYDLSHYDITATDDSCEGPDVYFEEDKGGFTLALWAAERMKNYYGNRIKKPDMKKKDN